MEQISEKEEMFFESVKEIKEKKLKFCINIMKKATPNYKRIYTDIMMDKYPEKITECLHILNKKTLSVMDIIDLNNRISSHNAKKINQQLKSYDRDTIFKILTYQKQHQLNNIETAKHFNLSRNSLQKWKKIYLV